MSDENEGPSNVLATKTIKRAKKEAVASSNDPNHVEEKVGSGSSKSRRGRSNRPFPAGPFEESATFAKQIYDFGSGQPVRRLSLFDHLQRTPDSGTSRQLITNANKYNLIKGNFASEQIELTPEGKRISDEATPPRERTRLMCKFAINDIAPFDAIYQRLTNAKLPARAALIDAMKDNGVSVEYVEEGVDTFIVNLKTCGLLQTLSGAERVVTVEHLLDTIPNTVSSTITLQSQITAQTNIITQEQASFETTCFYITPIGEDGSEARQHSNLFS